MVDYSAPLMEGRTPLGARGRIRNAVKSTLASSRTSSDLWRTCRLEASNARITSLVVISSPSSEWLTNLVSAIETRLNHMPRNAFIQARIASLNPRHDGCITVTRLLPSPQLEAWSQSLACGGVQTRFNERWFKLLNVPAKWGLLPPKL